MDTLIAEALRQAGSNPLLFIVILLLGKDFYEHRIQAQQQTEDAVVLASLRAMHESLTALCGRIDVTSGQSNARIDVLSGQVNQLVGLAGRVVALREQEKGLETWR